MMLVWLALVLCFGTVDANPYDDLNKLSELFVGRFDNIAQYQNDKNKPLAERHLHLITTAVPEKVPILIGFKTFYVEQYLNGNTSDIIRQRLYTYGVDPQTQQVILKLYSFANPQKFIHASANSSLFTSLTMNDLIYAEGCDVYWERLEDDYFRSNMYNTCIVDIGGAEVLIISRNNLTTNYLTADETWIFCKNQSILKVYPSPYNMSKFPVEVEQREKTLKFIPESYRIDSSQISDFNTLTSALRNGDQIRYFINPHLCQSNKANANVQGGYIEDFEYFFDPIFGPEHYFGFSSSSVVINSTGGFVTVLKEGFVYNNTGVKLTLTTLSLDFNTVLDVNTINCPFPSKTPAVTFHATGKQMSEITSFNDLITNLKNGGNIRFTADYRSCPPLLAGALSGGIIQDYEINTDASKHQFIRFTQSKVITNYQGSGFVMDVVLGSIYQNGTATFIASDLQTGSFRPIYKELIHCKLQSSVKLYLVP